MPKSYVAIFAATSFEFGLIRRFLSNAKRVPGDDVFSFTGMLNHQDVLLVKTGVGMENAKRVFNRVIDGDYSISVVFNVGIAGALNPDYAVGGVVLIDRVINENDKTIYAVRQLDSMINMDFSSIIKSTVISVNKPVFSKLRKNYYRTSFNADVVDMEAAVIIECSHNKRIPCCVIKGISDYADESANTVDGIVDNGGKLLFWKTTRYFLQRPIVFIKGLMQMYRNSKVAMKNAIGVMEKILNPSSADAPMIKTI